MKRIYPIFVPEKNVDDSEYSNAIKWCYDNLTHQNVIVLTSEDVYLLQYKSEVFDIINEENDGMLQMGEDDWIFSEKVKTNIYKKLNDYIKETQDARVKEIVTSLLSLIETSVKTNKNLYFLF